MLVVLVLVAGLAAVILAVYWCRRRSRRYMWTRETTAGGCAECAVLCVVVVGGEDTQLHCAVLMCTNHIKCLVFTNDDTSVCCPVLVRISYYSCPGWNDLTRTLTIRHVR